MAILRPGKHGKCPASLQEHSLLLSSHVPQAVRLFWTGNKHSAYVIFLIFSLLTMVYAVSPVI